MNQDCILLTGLCRFAKKFKSSILCPFFVPVSASFILLLGAVIPLFWAPLCVSIFYHYALVGITFEVFNRRFPSYRGLIDFVSGLRGAIFLTLMRNIMSNPPLDIFSNCGECSKNCIEKLGSLKLLCELKAI